MTAKLFGFIYIIFSFTYFDPCLKIRIYLIKTFTTFLCEKLEYLSMIKTIVSLKQSSGTEWPMPTKMIRVI